MAWSALTPLHTDGTLRLIEDPAGLIALLDEQCRLGERGSDDGFCSSLLKQHAVSAHLCAPRPPLTLAPARTLTLALALTLTLALNQP